jgi:hypothetical protein
MVTPADSNLDSEALCLVALGRRPAFLPVVDDRVSAFAQLFVRACSQKHGRSPHPRRYEFL